jgi:hypothetical protein
MTIICNISWLPHVGCFRLVRHPPWLEFSSLETIVHLALRSATILVRSTGVLMIIGWPDRLFCIGTRWRLHALHGHLGPSLVQNFRTRHSLLRYPVCVPLMLNMSWHAVVLHTRLDLDMLHGEGANEEVE